MQSRALPESGSVTVLRARRVVTPDGVRPAAVVVRAGVVVGVEAMDADVAAAHDRTLPDDIAVLPGLVDTHVHLQDPSPHDWEGFDSGTRAAAAGGITTLVDMPLDSTPVTVDVAALELKRAAACGRLHVDVAFWGGAVPGNLDRLGELWDAGVVGFKAYLVDPGLPDFPPLAPDELDLAMTRTAALGAVLAVHAELASHVRPPDGGGYGVGAVRDYRRFLDGQPASAEEAAVALVIAAAARRSRAPEAPDRGHAGNVAPVAHVVHVASAGSAALVAQARADGVAVTAETCPHHLALAAEQVPDGATAWKVCPPLRGEANREALWDELAAGSLAMVVSDHSPFDAALKHQADGDFARAAGGIVSLQLSLPALWTHARARGFGLAEVARWMAAEPAALVGLGRPGAGKGSIAVGNDADLCLFAPERRFVVDPAGLHHRQRVTPYDGMDLFGVVHETWLRGRPVDLTTPRGGTLSRLDLQFDRKAAR